MEAFPWYLTSARAERRPHLARAIKGLNCTKKGVIPIVLQICRGIIMDVMKFPTLPLLALCALFVGTATSAFALLKDPVSLFPKAGQTALLYDNGKVILKKDYTAASSIYTRYEYFIGTKEEVAAKIIELGLKDLPVVPTIGTGTK